MVKNIYSKISCYCEMHNKKLIPNGLHPQYICPMYYPKSETNPDGHEGEKCPLIISFEDEIKIVKKVEALVENDIGEVANYRGMKIKLKNVTATVIKHTDKHIDLSVRLENDVR